MGCTDLLRRGVSAPHQYPLGVSSKLPLSRYADVRLHIPMTHHNDAGMLRTANNFSFLRVYDAGHMVPRDQPAVALAMLNAFISNTLE